MRIHVRAINEIEHRLNHWSRWAKVEPNFGLGYPSETSIKKLMRDGVIIRSKYRPEPDDPYAETTEAAIREMPEHLREVIETYYFDYGSVEQKAKKLKMGRVTFHGHLRMAKYWLLGKWS
jgi:hypothetical protein